MKAKLGLVIVGWVLMVGGAMTVTLGLLQNVVGLPFRESVLISTANFKQVRDEEGMVGYRFQLPKRLTLPRRLSDLARVIEDDLALPKQGKSHGHVLKRGEGRFYVSERAVTFVTLDDSDPRVNGRNYRVIVPARWKTNKLIASGVAGLLGALVLVGSARGRNSLRWMISMIRRMPQRCEPWLRRWFCPYLIVWLALPSALLFATLPPLWKDDDALVQLLAPPSSMTILHFSWLYSALATLPGYLVDWLLASVGLAAWPGWAFWQPLPEFELRHAYALILTQHALLWLALAWIIRLLTRKSNPLVQVVMTVGCMIWAPFYTFAHLMGTEAGAMLGSLFLVGSAQLVIQRVTIRRMVLYGIALFAAACCRHIYALLAMVLPLALMSRALMDKSLGQSLWGRLRIAIPGILLSCLVAVLCFGGNALVKRAAGRVLGFENHSTFGRVAGTRETFFKCSQEVRDQWFPLLRAKLKSPHAAYALEAILFKAQYWAGGHDYVAAKIAEESGLAGEALELAVDRAYEEATKTILLAMPEPVLREIIADTYRVFFALDTREFAYSPISRHQKVERLLDEITSESIANAFWGGFGGQPAIDYDQAEPPTFALSAYLGLFDGVTAAYLMAIMLTLVAAIIWRAVGAGVALPDNIHLAIALAFSATCMMLVTNVIICFFDRYALPEFTLYPVAILILVAGIIGREHIGLPSPESANHSERRNQLR